MLHGTAIGEWLDINGDAIYGTRYWKEHAQKAGRLASTAKGKTLYAIALEEPTRFEGEGGMGTNTGRATHHAAR